MPRGAVATIQGEKAKPNSIIKHRILRQNYLPSFLTLLINSYPLADYNHFKNDGMTAKVAMLQYKQCDRFSERG